MLILVFGSLPLLVFSKVLIIFEAPSGSHKKMAV
jgi:hypothetical protein